MPKLITRASPSELGKIDEVLASYSEAIASKSDFAEAYYSVGITLQEMGKLEEEI